MDPRVTTLKAGFGMAHMVANAVVADLTEQVANAKHAGSTVPVGTAILAHALLGEDMMVNAQVRGAETVLSRGFAQKTGILNPSPMQTHEWLEGTYNLAGLKEYAQAVFAETMEWLDRATPAELDKMVATPIGQQVTGAEYLGGLAVVHLMEHIGELSALKGIAGAKGLPF